MSRTRPSRRLRHAAVSPAAGFGASTWTDPPAFSTAETADFEAPWTEKFTFAFSSPMPRSRTPSLARRRMPAFTRASESTVAFTSSLPASIALCTRSRFTSFSLSANFVFLKPRFGSRRCSGIWPPSKPLIATPERAVWPLPPRPPVLPLPEPMPRPMRMRFLRAPAMSWRSESFIGLLLVTLNSGRDRNGPSALDHADEVLDLRDHAAGHGRVRQLADAADLVQAEA